MSKQWLQSATVAVNDATGALLVEGFEGSGPVSVANVTSVAAATQSVTLLAVNASRRGLVIHNDSTATLWVKFGSAAFATSYTYELTAGAHLELSAGVFTGLICGIWETADGYARITELS